MAKKAVKSVVEQTGKIEVQEGVVEVTITKVPGAPERKTEKIKIRPFLTSTATVGVSFGATIPTVNYANAKFNVFASMPCYIEEMPERLNELQNFVEKKAEEIAAEIHNEIAGTGKDDQADFPEDKPETKDEYNIEDLL